MKIQGLRGRYAVQLEEGGMQVAGQAPSWQTVGYVLRILASFQKEQSIAPVGFRIWGIQDYLIFLCI